MNDRYSMLTPEKVEVSYRVAGLATRMGAHLIDLMLAFTLALVPALALSWTAPTIGDAAAQTIGSLASSAVLLGYFVAFEFFWQGQTPGKRAARARVVMIDGTPVTLAAVLFRNLLRPADMLPVFYLVGMLCMFTNERSQRLGDLAAGTMVIVERPPELGFTPAPHHVGIHRFESTVGNLDSVSLEEYQVLRQLRDRYPLLPLETQAWSIEHIWKPFAERHGIEPVPKVHPVYQMEAVIMKFGRMHNLV